MRWDLVAATVDSLQEEGAEAQGAEPGDTSRRRLEDFLVPVVLLLESLRGGGGGRQEGGWKACQAAAMCTPGSWIF